MTKVVKFENGVKFTVASMAKPRRSERTWAAASKYSIANIGAQASKTGRRGVRATPDAA